MTSDAEGAAVAPDDVSGPIDPIEPAPWPKRPAADIIPPIPQGMKPSTRYSEALADTICRRLVEGESLARIAQDDFMPALTTVYDWVKKYPEFAEKYHAARDLAIETRIDQLIDIADSEALDPNDKRVRIDTRKWLAATLKPTRYGNKVDLNLSGSINIGLADRLAAAIEDAGKS